MKSRPLKVGEYRKVKTWEQLLETDRAIEKNIGISINHLTFLDTMAMHCGKVSKIIKLSSGFSIKNDGFYDYKADFFTNDYYDSNGNEIEQESKQMNELIEKVKNMSTDEYLELYDSLDQLELETNLTLAKIAKLREIEAKQVEMDKLGLEIEQMIEEYLR